MKKWAVLIACGAMIAAGVGCTAVSNMVTPATVDRAAVAYVEKAGVADANAFAGYPNLEKANRLAAAVRAAYEVNVLAVKQLAEKNELDYGLLSDVVTKNLEIAQEREGLLFSETGLLSMGLSALGAGGLAGFLGLMRKRPGDFTATEVEQTVAAVKGEVTAKDRQIIELVKGVQEFMDKQSGGEQGDRINEVLKTVLAMNQSADTKQAVAAIKATT